MWLSDLGEKEVEIVHVIDGSNALVEGIHDRHSVLGQFLAGRLFIASLQLLELGEHVQQLFMFLKQSKAPDGIQ